MMALMGEKDGQIVALEGKLDRMELRMDDEASGVQGQLSVVAQKNSVLSDKVGSGGRVGSRAGGEAGRGS